MNKTDGAVRFTCACGECDATAVTRRERKVIGALLMFLLGAWITLGATLVFGEEHPRLKEIAYEKQLAEMRFEKAKVDQQNAQYKFRELTEEENRIKADMKKAAENAEVKK